MPLFKVGDFDDVGLTIGMAAIKGKAEVESPDRINTYAYEERSLKVEPPMVNLLESEKAWGLALTKIALYRSFEVFLFPNATNQIYFTTTAWDYSGDPPYVYPPKDIDPATLLLKMKEGQTREFIGDGVMLWPPRKVVGALNIIILIYECDSNIRKVGERLADIHDGVKTSSLASLITAISLNPALATAVAIGNAVNELMAVMGYIMKKNGDDFVDLFEGSFGTDKEQVAESKRYKQDAAGIVLDLKIT